MKKSQITGNRIPIIGGGISGITTGIVLQLLGFKTIIITKQRADQPEDPCDPMFASLSPSASIIPHSVFGENINQLFNDSQIIFEILRSKNVPGVTLHKHYEVYEEPVKDPFYANCLNEYRRIDDIWETDPEIPRMPSTQELHGWVFDCFFTEWPVYLPLLFSWYERVGGIIQLDEVTPENLADVKNPIINCSGLGSRLLFEDSSAHTILNGHIIKISGAPPVKSESGQIISYNYNPKTSIYSDAEGNEQDVYCYPRPDGLILGGSRLKGTIDSDNQWAGITVCKPMEKINGIQIPASIIKLNTEILETSYGINLIDYANTEATTGYRYIRDEKKGLRLEATEESGKKIIHNYGHGGAGVTLSWGCAVRIAALLKELDGSKMKKSDLLETVKKELSLVIP